MFITALWVLEQEQKAFDWMFPYKKQLSSTSESIVAGGLLTAAAGQTALIGSTPYSLIARVSGNADLYLRQVALDAKWYNPSGFKFGGKLGIIPTYTKHRAGKVLAAKIGARFIPYAGWALFAYDMWHVGKWIGEKTNPFTS